MKRVILSVLMVSGLTFFASAQTNTGGSGSRTTAATSATGTTKAKKSAKKKPSLNHRKNYPGKNGQTATPTGQEATGVGGGSFSAPRKDTSGKRTGE